MESPDQPPPVEDLLAWLVGQAGGMRKLAKQTGVSATTLRRWRGGDFPRTRHRDTVDAVHTWAARELRAAYPPPGYPRRGLLAYLGSQDSETTSKEDQLVAVTTGDRQAQARIEADVRSYPAGPQPASADRPQQGLAHHAPADGQHKMRPRARRWNVALAIGLVLSLSLVSDTTANQPPSAGSSPVTTPGCAPRKTWRTVIDPNYRGRISIQMYSPVGVQHVDVHMTWGRFQRDDTIELHPGDPATNTGGALWRPLKRSGPSDPNPGLVVHASVPVCVEFGTTQDSPVAPKVLVSDEGWY